MIEIKKLLEKGGYQYLDAELSWNTANWQAYLDADGKKIDEFLKANYKIVGIELSGKKPDSDQFINIDHHNEEQSQPASIEQIGNLLEVELDRWQQLVAANDKGYIPAMEMLEGTVEEIEKVRTADRSAQGVTEEDEKLAQQSIDENQEQDGGVTVVRSLTEHFSAIADRMYGRTERLLIYTDTTLNYYGNGKDKVAEAFLALVEEGKAYHGGGDKGFLGLAKGSFEEGEINKYRNEVIKIINE